MVKVHIVAAAVLAVTLAQPNLKVPGPTVPYVDGFVCSEEGEKVVDIGNMCWYHECVKRGDESLATIPRRCALGSKISQNFVSGMTNPCTVNFDDVIGYDCRRTEPSIDGPPPCFAELTGLCDNGGTLVYESNKCWCMCPPSWQGDYDCSKPTGPTHVGPDPTWCREDGVEDGNLCEELDNPCQNGGTCVDVCTNYWCMCPDNEDVKYGKNCESYPSN